jgi:hypothetical protein
MLFSLPRFEEGLVKTLQHATVVLKRFSASPAVGPAVAP